jgi:putative transposase
MKQVKAYKVDIHFIGRSNPAWVECDILCWYAKNLQNYANFIIRQEYINNKRYINYNEIERIVRANEADCYFKLPGKIAQSILMELDQNWKSFFKGKAEYKKNPNKFTGPPKMPKYKEKKNGRVGVHFNNQTMSKVALRENLLKLSSLNFLTKFRLLENIDSDGVVTYSRNFNLREASILPRHDGYQVIVKYLDVDPIPKIESGYSAGIDLGVNNLAAIATTNKEKPAFLLNGKPLKSINAFYNKKLAKMYSELALNTTKKGKKRIQRKIQKLCRKRFFKVKHYLHEASKMVVNQLVSSGVTHIVVGKNIGWKQETNIGKVGNQNFINIPHARFIDMLKYKWEKLGRTFETVEEAYTSKCSFLDKEEIGKQETYLGKRGPRGLFTTKEHHKINSDVNGAGNILRKVISNAFDLWSDEDLIQGFVISPRRLTTALLERVVTHNTKNIM